MSEAATWPQLRRFMLALAMLGASLACWTAASLLVEPPREAMSAARPERLDVPVASIRRVPEAVTESRIDQAVAATTGLLADEDDAATCVTALLDGVSVFDVRGDRPLVPAYAQLLVTAHAALVTLGPDHRYETRLLAAAPAGQDGRVEGDVFLIGGGDPVLMTEAYAAAATPTRSVRTSIEELAELVVEAGVLTIDGSLVAVERRYDAERGLPGWPEEYREAGIVGPLSALLVDGGLAGPAQAASATVASDEPAALAAERFAQALAASGAFVDGGVRVLAADETLPELVELARIESPPLSEIVRQMLLANDATVAELVLKELAVADGGAGTTQAGSRVAADVVASLGVELEVPFRDASGIDPVGGTTCRQLAGIADAIETGDPTIDVLPRFDAGEVFDGRFASLDLDADLRVVGGLVGDASGLVARTIDSGSRVTVVVLVNRVGGPNETDLALQSEVVAMVDTLRGSDALAELAPGQE